MTYRSLAFFAAVLLPAASALAVTSTFDRDEEGWSVQGNSAAPVIWMATGGNPRGHIIIDDATQGGVTYFVAPAAFLGDHAAAYGLSLTFDLKQTITGGPNQFNADDVIIEGGGLRIVYNLATNPPFSAWQSYAVPLSEAGWHLNSASGPAVTPAQMQQVLGSITSLHIRAEYQTGPDIGALDNVTLPTPLLGDINGDGAVDGADLGLLLGAWGACPGCPEDLNGDGSVDGADLGLLLGGWT